MNKTQILNKYCKAANQLKEAQKTLLEIAADYHNWSSEDAKDYAHQLGELLSCDHGEAGIEALIRTLEGHA